MLNRVSIAHIRRTKGVRGWVCAEPLTDNLDRFCSVESVVIQKEGSPDQTVTLEKWKQEKSTLLLKFVEVDSPEIASVSLVTGYVTVSKDEVPTLPLGTHYIFDVVGCKVEDTTGALLGKVSDVMSLPSNDIFIVNGPHGEVLVPAVKDIVLEINTTDRHILVCGVEELML